MFGRLTVLLGLGSAFAANDSLELRAFGRSQTFLPDWQVERILTTSGVQARQSVVGFVDPEVCYPALANADADGNGLVSYEEFVSFSQEMIPSGLLNDVSTFEDLPAVLQATFFTLACLCQTDPEDDSCCVGDNAAISVDGANADDVPSAAEEAYLFIVCSLTADAVDRVLQSTPPTNAPTSGPTPSPTVPLTAAPTPLATTLSPTVTPGSPTSTPTEAPTGTPTTPTTTPPPSATLVPVQLPISVYYEIGVRPGGEPEVYLPELVSAMDALAPTVLAEVLAELGGDRRMLLRGRRLESVQLSFPTRARVVQGIECPDSPSVAADDTCEKVSSNLALVFEPDVESPEDIADVFVQELQDAIASGELYTSLSLFWPDTFIYILDDTIVDRGIVDPNEDSDTVSAGGVAGIVVGALAVVAVLGFLATRRGPTKDETVEALQPVPPQKEIEPFDPTGALGAVTADYGKDQDAMIDNDEALNNMSMDTSSNAGDSGWSSSAGVSSLNTGDEEIYPVSSSFGSTLRALGMDAATSESMISSRDVPKAPAVTRADLDSAIEQGDWAAVGATAALLAAASDSQSVSSQSASKLNTSGTGSRSEGSTLDAARAAELDQLVESGDWEGVVLAAAKYEVGSDSVSGGSQSSATHESRSTRQIYEYRQEVEDLVRRVVPDELRNVDEMMMQFRGREDELIETLRTMEERAVAQRARDATQKQAKTQAKQKTPQQRAADATALLSTIGSPDTEVSFQETTSPSLVRSLGSGQVTSATKSLGTGVIVGSAKSKSMGTGEIVDKGENKHSALEAAIEAGDWQAVGDAAATLSDHSLASSVETDEILRLADGISSQGSFSSRGNTSDKAEELEDLIEKGDWTGVVNAAAGMSSEASKRKGAEEEARRLRRLKKRKEEEDAVAKAGIWDAIAQQSKEGDATAADRAGVDAEEWAIGRSLDALGQAGKGDALTK